MSLHQFLKIGRAEAGDRHDFQLRQDLKNQKQIKNWQAAIAIMSLLGAGFVLGQKFQPQQPTTAKAVVNTKQTNILPVKTTAVQPVTAYSQSQTYTGEVAALRTSEVGFERGGKLVQVLVEEGERIDLGASLAKLDTANLEAQHRGLIAQK
ncbi:MAG: efflux transporter periplasmic adaptor subunit, partial [Cyanobacteria bacterium J06555_3]